MLQVHIHMILWCTICYLWNHLLFFRHKSKCHAFYVKKRVPVYLTSLFFFFSSHQSSVWDTSGSRPIVGQGVCSSQTFGELSFNFSGGFLISGSVVHVFIFFLCEIHWLIYSVCYHVSQLVTRQFQYAANFGHVNLFLLPNNFTVGR